MIIEKFYTSRRSNAVQYYSLEHRIVMNPWRLDSLSEGVQKQGGLKFILLQLFVAATSYFVDIDKIL